jgi:putative transposase
MARKKFTEEQIVHLLREADTGLTVDEICRKHEISRNTFYRWRKAYGGLDADGARQAKRLEEENRKLKKKLAELVMENEDLKHLLSKKW